MSEWLLRALQNSATSNLNTSYDTYLTLRLIVIGGRRVGQAGTLVPIVNPIRWLLIENRAMLLLDV